MPRPVVAQSSSSLSPSIIRRRAGGAPQQQQQLVSVYLKDIGSGNGFMLPDRVFLYQARRTYLYDDDNHSSSSKEQPGAATEAQEEGRTRLDPPVSFMSKKQLARRRLLESNKKSVSTNPKVQSIEWVAVKQLERMSTQKPATAEMLIQRVLAVESSSHNRNRARARPTVAAVQEAPAFVASEWEKVLEAGCHFYCNKRTLEIRTEINSLAARGVASPLPSSRRPASAPPLTTEHHLLSMSSVEDDSEFGVGALVYSGREIHSLLDYLEQESKVVLLPF